MTAPSRPLPRLRFDVVLQLMAPAKAAVAAIDEEAYLKAEHVAYDQSHRLTGAETEFDR